MKARLMAMSILIMLIFIFQFDVQEIEAQTYAYILPNHSGYVNDHGYYYIVGEIENNGSFPITGVTVNETYYNVVVNATYYDSTGTIIGYTYGNMFLDVLLPGRKAPFEIILYSATKSEKVHNYTLSLICTAAKPKPLGLEIVNNSYFIDESGFHVVGEIKNVGSDYTSYVRVIVTFYNASGYVIAARSSYTSPLHLYPEEIATFELILNASIATKVDHYALEAESMQYALVPEINSVNFLLTLILTAHLIGISILKAKKNKCVSVVFNS